MHLRSQRSHDLQSRNFVTLAGKVGGGGWHSYCHGSMAPGRYKIPYILGDEILHRLHGDGNNPLLGLGLNLFKDHNVTIAYLPT